MRLCSLALLHRKHTLFSYCNFAAIKVAHFVSQFSPFLLYKKSTNSNSTLCANAFGRHKSNCAWVVLHTGGELVSSWPPNSFSSERLLLLQVKSQPCRQSLCSGQSTNIEVVQLCLHTLLLVPILQVATSATRPYPTHTFFII